MSSILDELNEATPEEYWKIEGRTWPVTRVEGKLYCQSNYGWMPVCEISWWWPILGGLALVWLMTAFT